MYILSEREAWLCTQIVDCAIKVHKELGPGLLEKIYEACFCYELGKRGIKYERQVYMPVLYDGQELDEGLKLDVLMDDLVVCEIKAIDKVNPIWQAQAISHMRMTGKHVGFVLNFNVVLMKEGIRRYCIERFYNR